MIPATRSQKKAVVKFLLRISESSIQETCCDWMLLDGWRRIRTDMKQLRGMGVQEKGMADDLFIRYMHRDGAFPAENFTGKANAEVLWVEWKAKKGVHGQKQVEWQRLERARGALVWVAKQDFEASIEGYQAHYADSGLLRKQGLRPRRKEVKVAGA